MNKNRFYVLPQLPYGYDALEPYISKKQLEIHYLRHHQAYIAGANAMLTKLDKAREENSQLDLKAILKTLSFNIGGHLLHSFFWENLAPRDKEEPLGILRQVIDKEFGSFERFKKEFSQVALSVEGSGWAALAFCRQTERPIIMQIEKHNTNIYPTFGILLVLDVFEHAYYLDYLNERAKFIDAFWNIVNWNAAERRLKGLLK